MPKTTRYSRGVKIWGSIVCIQTLVKRRTSRASSVLKVRSVRSIAYDLHVDLFDVRRVVPLLQPEARPLRDDLAAVDKRYLLAERLGLFQVVRREQDGHPAAVQLPDVAPQAVAQLDVNTRGRLVEEEDLRVVHEGPGEHHAPLHPAGEGVRPLVPLLDEAEPFEQLRSLVFGLLLRDAVVAGVEDEDLLDGKELVEVYLLRRDAYHAPRLLELREGVLPVDLDGARVRPRQADDAVDERGLARPVGAGQPGGGPAAHPRGG